MKRVVLVVLSCFFLAMSTTVNAGTISSAVEWKTDRSPIEDITIVSGGSLDIYPGVTVTPDNGVSIIVDGGTLEIGEPISGNNDPVEIKNGPAGGHWGGIIVLDTSSVTIENTVLKNGGDCDYCTSNSLAEAMVYVEDEDFEIIDSDITDSDTHGIYVKLASSSDEIDIYTDSASYTYIRNSADDGLQIEEGVVDCDDCYIDNNGEHGIIVKTGGEIDFTDSISEDNHWTGCYLYGGDGVFSGATLRTNDTHGIRVSSGGDLSSMLDSTISYNDEYGIYLTSSSSISVVDTTDTNDIIYNYDEGIRMTGGTATITGANIGNNTDHGIVVTGGTLTMTSTDIHDQGRNGVWITGGSGTHTFTTVDIYDNGRNGIRSQGGIAEFKGCDTYENNSGASSSYHGVYVNGGDVTYENNGATRGKIYENGNTGVYKNSGTLDLYKANIYDNDNVGVHLAEGGSADTGIDDCYIYNSTTSDQDYGLYIDAGSSTYLIEDSDIHDNEIDGVYIDGESADFCGNDIWDNGGTGVYLVTGSAVFSNGCTKNIIYDNSDYGIYVGGTVKVFGGTEIYGNSKTGIYVNVPDRNSGTLDGYLEVYGGEIHDNGSTGISSFYPQIYVNDIDADDTSSTKLHGDTNVTNCYYDSTSPDYAIVWMDGNTPARTFYATYSYWGTYTSTQYVCDQYDGVSCTGIGVTTSTQGSCPF